MEKYKKTPCFFSAVARLTESHHSIKPRILIAFTSNDFINFFNNKTVLRENILRFTDSSSTTGTTEAITGPDMFGEPLCNWPAWANYNIILN